MPNKKIYTNTLAQIAGKIMTALISIFMIKILTNYLDVAGYGMYSKIYNYLSIFAVIADLGLYTITVRELSKHEWNSAEQEKISANVLSLRTVSWICIIALSLSLAPFLSGYDSPMAMIGIGIASLFTLLGLMNSSLMSYLQATLRAEYSFVTNTSWKLLTFWMIILFASVLYPLHGGTSELMRYTLVMIAGLAGNILMLMLTYFYTKKFIRVRFEWDTSYIKKILRESLPYWVALFLGAVFFKVDTILLSVLESPEIADIAVALYALPMKLVEVGMMYGMIFLTSTLPIMTRQSHEKDVDGMQKTISQAFEVLFAFWLALSLFLSSFPKQILLLLSWEKYIETTVLGYSSPEALSIVAWIFLFYFLSSLLSFILIARGEQTKIIIINLIVALLNFVWNLIFIPDYTFIGASYVTLVSQILLIFLSIYMLRGTIKYRSLIIKASILTLTWIVAISISRYSVEIFTLTWLHPFVFLSITWLIFSSIYLAWWWSLRKFFAFQKSSI